MTYGAEIWIVYNSEEVWIGQPNRKRKTDGHIELITRCLKTQITSKKSAHMNNEIK